MLCVGIVLVPTLVPMFVLVVLVPMLCVGILVGGSASLCKWQSQIGAISGRSWTPELKSFNPKSKIASHATAIESNSVSIMGLALRRPDAMTRWDST